MRNLKGKTRANVCTQTQKRFTKGEIVKQVKGITLIALVITIIILVILAGVSTALVIGNNGIMKKAEQASKESGIATAKDEVTLILNEYAMERDLENKELMAFLQEQKQNKRIEDVIDNEDDSVIIKINGYEVRVEKNNLEIVEAGEKATFNRAKTEGKIDIVFLIGTTDNYYDKNGNIQTAQRQTSEEQIIETDASKTDKYTVHPAFTNESSINYANGGWDKELTGIWVSKFEAGYAGGNNTATVKDSSVSYSEIVSNYYGTNTEKVKIKYPTFQGLTYSMNLISTSDAFDISKALVENGNIYGLNSSTDSHLIKNSEWGAVAYLGQSKYGLDEVEICMNNANLNDTTKSVYAITGCSGKSSKENQVLTTVEKINSRKQEDIYVWTQKNGTKASSTGTIYGVYDMAGGAWERTTGLINNGDANLMQLRKIINEYTSKWKKFKICNCISI